MRVVVERDYDRAERTFNVTLADLTEEQASALIGALGKQSGDGLSKGIVTEIDTAISRVIDGTVNRSSRYLEGAIGA